MERTSFEAAKLIFGENFIGPDELRIFLKHFGDTKYSHSQWAIPEIPWSEDILKALSSNYIFILGLPEYNGIPLTIRNLRSIFGIDPEVSEPCFYNQDWYLNEEFIDHVLQFQWYLIRKDVFDSARAVDPGILEHEKFHFPSAILCCYTFFAYWFARNACLWMHDFIWCSDKDHNGDRIYVGKYHDIDGINKNGFSIHRHLALRPCYSAIDCIANK